MEILRMLKEYIDAQRRYTEHLKEAGLPLPHISVHKGQPIATTVQFTKALDNFRNEEYPSHKSELEKIQQLPERYQEEIFEVEKKGNHGDFSTYKTKRTRGLVESIEESFRKYPSAAFLVSDKNMPISSIGLTTEHGKGILEFPRQLSDSEREALIGSCITYEERYGCHNEGAIGLLQSWDYKIEVLDGHKKGMKLEEHLTV